LYFYKRMKNKFWQVIGLMSGTSLDGVDLVFVKFTREQTYSFEILKTESIIYSEKWKKNLFNAFYASGEELTRLHVDYGKYLGELVNDFIKKNKIKKVDFIASHGHTIFHQPELHYTLQIGSGAVISAETKLKVICDFRVQDLAFGGQGAPLVPIGDQLLFSTYDFCLNLGGFANISFQNQDTREAFDICPVNIVLNHFTRKIGLEYDDRGELATRGILNKVLVEELNQLPFYKDDKPKSLGYEYIDQTVIPIIDNYDLDLNDVLRSFIEHVAFQISEVINKKNSLLKKSRPKVLVTGGGAYNDFLIKRIREMADCRLIVPENKIIDFKEALIFAFLGVLKDENEINCLKSVTGAFKDHSSGLIYHP